MNFARALKSFRHASMLGVLAVAALPTTAFAVAGQHGTLASFQQNVRADVYLRSLSGPPNFDIPPVNASGNGYAYTVHTNNGTPFAQDSSGVGSNSDSAATRFMIIGRPVTAFAGTLRVTGDDSVPIADTVVLTTDTGETFTVPVVAGGTFFGFTTSQPFTQVDIDTPMSAGSMKFEAVDNVYVGTSSTAAVMSDQCIEAVTINPITAALYPFSTVSSTGATTTEIPGSCAFNPSLDNGSDVWIRFVSPVYGNVTVNTCGANFDTVLRVFANCGPAGTGVGATHIVCNDDFCTGGSGALASQVQFRAEAGEDYLIRISGYDGAAGSGTLNFSVVPDCQADFNHTGMKDVQDIFDFLNSWFGGC